jgi:hypothetical protein
VVDAHSFRVCNVGTVRKINMRSAYKGFGSKT